MARISLWRNVAASIACLFIQKDWPVSDCIDWQKNRGGRCSIKDYHHWTINGIHTGRHDGQKSPEFCDKKPLQISKLRPLLANLTLEWTSDHARTDQAPFWSYIWYKYGSCFQASRLHGPLKYFAQALQWHQRYPLDKFLANGAIQPGNPYLVEDIHLAIKSATYGKIPALDCVRSNNDTVVLSQITLCFNLRLRLIHCRSKMFPQGIFGNCPRRSIVVYPKDSDHIGAWSQTGNSSLSPIKAFIHFSYLHIKP